MNASTHTIAALSTPPGRSALAVIRLTGDGAQKIFTKVIAEKEKFRKEAARRIGIYTIIDTAHTDTKKKNEVHDKIRTDAGTDRQNQPNTDNTANGDTTYNAIDEVTAIKYNAPHSYTGEDMVEIFCHGGAIIPEKIIEQLFRRGALAAGRGEFSRRALVNGKIGILKAESIRELIESQTETHLRSAQLAYFGKQSELIERLKQEIVAVLSDIESRIEFGEDDDVAKYKQQQISANKKQLALIIASQQDELWRNDRAKALDDGIVVAIAGPANAGKSSLFNEILGYDRSIVHNRPGTTRDIVSERLIFDGMTVKLFDSAGIRKTGDEVEKLGIDRTMSAVTEAHAVLWVTSAMDAFEEGEQKEILRVAGIGGESGNYAINGDSHRAQIVDIYNGYGNSREKDRVVLIINKIDLDGSVAVDFVETDDRSAVAVPNIDTDKTITISDVGTNNKNKTITSLPDKSHLIEKKQFCEEHKLKYVETSITQKFNRKQLFNVIYATIREVKTDTPTPAIIINERHSGIIEAVIRELRGGLDNIDREEIAAHCLRMALDWLSEFSGHVGSDEVLNEIFERFCIGK